MTRLSALPTDPNPSHDVTLEDGLGNKYGLILQPRKALDRQPRQSSKYTPITFADWSGGRGIFQAEDDQSRFADSKRLNSARAGRVYLGPQETYTSGHRLAEQHMPADASGVTWQDLVGADRDIAFQVTATGTGSTNRARIYFWVRRRGTPTGDLQAELCANGASVPGAVLKSVTVTPSQITDVISQLYEFSFPVQAVTAGTTYWVKARAMAADVSGNCWQVGTDAAGTPNKTKRAPDNTTWTDATYDLYFRLVDDLENRGVRKFFYKSQLYMLTLPVDVAAPELYMNGYRGVATGTPQSRTVLKDTTQAWTPGALVGGILLIFDGPNSEGLIPYRTITGNDGTTITTAAFPRQHVDKKTAYVVLGLDVWTKITGHGLTEFPTSVCDAGDIAYFAQGDFTKLRRMIERNINGVWTRSFSEENNYAHLLLAYRHAVKGTMVIKANNFDNSSRPSVAQSKTQAWGQRLDFPQLLNACEVTTGWTFAASVTGSADATEFKTGSASIKMVVAAGAPTTTPVGYYTFSPAVSLRAQKRIRLWVYSNAELAAGALKFRISKDANCGTAIEDVDFPIIETSTWTQVILKYKDNANNITGVQSVGIIKTAASGTIYVDGIETLPAESEVQLGNDQERITGLELYGDPEVPWVFRSGSVGSIENGTYQPIPLREYRQVESIHNGVAHVVHDVYLYWSFLHGVEQWYRNNLDDVGPNQDEGLPNNREGYITSMVGYPDRIFAAMDAGNAGYSSILVKKGSGWHEIYRCDTRGKRIRNLHLQIIPGNTADRLWFDEGEDIAYLRLPGNAVNELEDATYRYTHESVLETGWIGTDEKRHFTSIRVQVENATTTRKIEWDYKLDEDAAWTVMPTAFENPPVQVQSLGVTGYRMKLRFRIQSNSNAQTPRIRRIQVSTTLRPETRYTFTMAFVTSDNAVDGVGDLENYAAAATLISQLDTWMKNMTPLTMHSIWSPMDNRKVVLDPIPITPQAIVTNEGLEKLRCTLVAIEPES